jgi:hypothetical protein
MERLWNCNGREKLYWSSAAPRPLSWVLVSSILSQLKRNRNICCGVDRLAITGSGMETNLLRHTPSLFVQSMAETVNHTLHLHLSGSRKGHPQNHIPLDPQ